MSSRNKPDNPKASKSKPSLPQRPRHQIKRSITELSSPIRLSKADNSRHHHFRDHDSDELDPVSANPTFQYPRTSLDLARSVGTTNDDQRINFLLPSPENISAVPGTRISQPYRSKEEEIVKEQEKMASTITFVSSTLLTRLFIYLYN